MSDTLAKIRDALGEYFPSVIRRLSEGDDVNVAIVAGMRALEEGSLSWAQLNQILHRCSEAGVSEGFFRYYFLEVPPRHPYPVDRVFPDAPFEPPEGTTDVKSVRQLQWGLRRFIYDAMLYWGNFRQAFRELRQCHFDEICEFFWSKRMDEGRMTRRGKVEEPARIPQDSRHLISEQACKTFQGANAVEEAEHVKLALQGFSNLCARGAVVTPQSLKKETRELAKGGGQLGLFELMYEDAERTIETEAEVIALYSGQWEAFQKARGTALENTRVYLSICNDLDVYVAGSMRHRDDFRDMARTCEEVFGSHTLRKYNIRYFDPSLSATRHHEDKGLIECLMVKTAKVVLYLSQQKESLGKVSEYAMGVTLGKPVIVLCPDDERGREMYMFYRDRHPLMRLVQFETGVANGAMVTHKLDVVIKLLERIFADSMEYDLARKEGTDAYYLLKERVTGATIRVITDDKLLTETFWNNWHEVVSSVRRPHLEGSDFQSTGLQLNREHPLVQATVSRNGARDSFQPVPIRGEPASATLIQDRR